MFFGLLLVNGIALFGKISGDKINWPG